MWIYQIACGVISDGQQPRAVGYSGFQAGLNDPDLESHPDLGPIPHGLYTINAPQDTTLHGPYVLSLTPDPGNEMHGREGFLIHGDEIDHPTTHMASRGCIILPPDVRRAVWESGDHQLRVVRGESVFSLK